MGHTRTRRMLRELRAEPSTQFFEPILCGSAWAPLDDSRDRVRSQAPGPRDERREPGLGEIDGELPLPR